MTLRKDVFDDSADFPESWFDDDLPMSDLLSSLDFLFDDDDLDPMAMRRVRPD